MKKIKLADINGFNIAAVKAGIKASGNLDLGLIIAKNPAAAAGVFTTNKVCAAPVKLSRKNIKLAKGMIRGILVNAGNANACTGDKGLQAARETTRHLAKLINCSEAEILTCSTGIIGEQLPIKLMCQGIDAAFAKTLKKKATGSFAKAIMTTDTFAKERGLIFKVGKKSAKIAGVAKGVGMLAPDMATMLAFFLSNIKIHPKVLQEILRDVVAETFNCVTVDGDTSTNDTCLCLTSDTDELTIGSRNSAAAKSFYSALHDLAYELSYLIAQDGEGATTVIKVMVSGAATKKDAKRVARTVAESPLVKTAIAGRNPNWGRIMMAIGRSGAKVEEKLTLVKLSGITFFKFGAPINFNKKEVAKAMQKKEVTIAIDLGLGKANAYMLTCDLTHGYISINADYHT